MEKYIKLVGLDIVYFILVTIFLYKLNTLNHILLLKEAENENVFFLLTYNDFSALKYFSYAIVFLFLAVILIYFKYKMYTGNYHTPNEICTIIIATIGLFISIFLIIFFINNPILRMILSAICITMLGIISLTNK